MTSQPIRSAVALLTFLVVSVGTTESQAEIRCGKFGCYNRGQTSSFDHGAPAARVASARRGNNWRTALRERQRTVRRAARERARQESLAATRAATSPPVANRVGIPVTELNVTTVPVLTRDGIRRIQLVLRDKGFDPGPVNGIAGPQMKTALGTFQKRYGIASDGALDNQTLLALGEAELASQSNR